MNSSDTVALILCAGKGKRTGLDYNKIFYTLPEGVSVISKVLDVFSLSKASRIILVVDKNDEDKIREFYDGEYVFGGKTRGDSVINGLHYIKRTGGCETVVIHDGARPYVSVKSINACIDSAKKYGSGVTAVKSIDTIKVARNGKIVEELDRNSLVNIQTPQAFDFDKILKAYEDFYRADDFKKFTDDSAVFAKIEEPVIVEGEYSNIKLTNPCDLTVKVGTGFDAHRLVEGRKLILGGVDIPNDKGLLGHSDADVLLHAICDALLSAAGLPDIGVLFPDTDPTYKDIASSIILLNVLDEIKKRGYTPLNISAVIMAQKPKLSPYIHAIRLSIAAVTGLAAENINVSATTTEKLGIVGEEKGIASSAVCLIKKS